MAAFFPSPFFITGVNSFIEVPRWRSSPRSHWFTNPVVRLKWKARDSSGASGSTGDGACSAP